MAENLDESSVGFLYKAMMQRGPNKRKVKVVPQHKMLINFAGLGDSSDDSDFEIGKKKGSKGKKDESSNSDTGSDNNDDDDDGSDEDTDDTIDEDEEDDDDEDEDDDKESTATKEEADDPAEGTKPSIADYLERTKERLTLCENSKAASEDTVVSSVSSRRPIKMAICGICLGDITKAENEVVDCDGCGVSVHEGCYGINESASVESTLSSASTEPWFCDACKAGVTPVCELCPNSGGLYKETDAGKWVHLVCALYVPGVAFGNVDLLTPVTLFEMQYSKWGAKECSLCEDSRYSRCGVCICCDAGMCRNFFHVTCAQRDGLLSEATAEEDIADPFYAYCKQHVDKSVMRYKRRNYLALNNYLKNNKPQQDHEQKGQERVKRKLEGHQRKYLENKAVRPTTWIPPQKLARPLTSCPSALKRLIHKAELLGMMSSHTSHPTAAITVPSAKDIRKKWHIQPAFTPEFVSYVHDREERLTIMRKHGSDLVAQREKLQAQERLIRLQYDKLSSTVEQQEKAIESKREAGEKLWKILSALTKKGLKLPSLFAPKKSPAKKNPSKQNPQTNSTQNNRRGKTEVIHRCRICSSTSDQHMLAHCESCQQYMHIHCLDPPLTRLPKKSKMYSWQCSKCAEREEEEEVKATNPAGDASSSTHRTRKLRKTIREPKKFTPSLINSKKSKKGKGKGKAPAPPPPPAKTLVLEEEPHQVEEATTPPETVQQEMPETGEVKVQVQQETGEVKMKNTARKSTISHPRKSSTPQPSNECTMCFQQGDNSNLVRCDECNLYYHFHCLQPPQTRTPRVRGYSWMCMACQSPVESEEESDNQSNNGLPTNQTTPSQQPQQQHQQQQQQHQQQHQQQQQDNTAPTVVEISSGSSNTDDEEIHSNVSQTPHVHDLDDDLGELNNKVKVTPSSPMKVSPLKVTAQTPTKTMPPRIPTVSPSQRPPPPAPAAGAIIKKTMTPTPLPTKNTIKTSPEDLLICERQPRKRQRTARMKEYLGIATEDDEEEESPPTKRKSTPSPNKHMSTVRTSIVSRMPDKQMGKQIDKQTHKQLDKQMDNGKTNHVGKSQKRSHSPDKAFVKRKPVSVTTPPPQPPPAPSQSSTKKLPVINRNGGVVEKGGKQQQQQQQQEEEEEEESSSDSDYSDDDEDSDDGSGSGSGSGSEEEEEEEERADTTLSS